MTVSLTHLVPSSKTSRDHTIASLTEFAHSFANTPVDVGDKNTIPLFCKTSKSLKNADIVITKPDKINGVVLLDMSDYFLNLEMIVKDRSKFMYLGPCNKYDKATKFEMKLNRILKELRDKSEIEEEVYNQIRSTGLSRPCLYGLLKRLSSPIHPFHDWLSTTQLRAISVPTVTTCL